MAKKAGFAEFSFGPGFQEEMLALMLGDLTLAMKAIIHVPKERLYSEAHQFLFERIKHSIDKRGNTPTWVEIEDHLKTVEKHRRRMLKNFCKSIFEIKVKSPEFIKDKLTDYAKRNAFIDIFQSAQTFYNAKQTKEAYEYTMNGIGELYTINFREDAAITIDQFEAIRQVYLHSASALTRRIPTNIEPLDEILRGGLEKGELGILLAEPKKGKSIGLIHMGAAALMMRRGRVAHFVLEGTTEQTVLRYQTRLTEILYRDLELDKITKKERARLHDLAVKYTNRLDLIPMNAHWTYTALDVESKLKELKRVGREPDLTIIDYGDLLKHHEPTGSPREEQTEVFRALKRIAMIHSQAIWTASQARRPSDSPDKEYILRARDIAECYEKVRIADLVCTLNQTQRERKLGIMRFCVDIYRSNDTDKIIRLIQDYERMIFYSKRLGHVERNETPAWIKGGS